MLIADPTYPTKHCRANIICLHVINDLPDYGVSGLVDRPNTVPKLYLCIGFAACPLQTGSRCKTHLAAIIKILQTK